MKYYVGDFETTTDKTDLRVWAYAIANIETEAIEEIGNNIDDFMEYIKDTNSIIYFHNLKFDGEYVLSWLLKNNWKYSATKEPNTFETLITDDGVFYYIDITYKLADKKRVHTTIYDSLKVLPFKVSEVAKAFKLPISKLEIDYHQKREKGHQLTNHEIAYVRNDVLIIASALHQLQEEGITKMTAASNAFSNFKKTLPCKYRTKFPELSEEVDEFSRRAYRGGYVLVNSEIAEKDIGAGMVFDVNSLYPYSMRKTENIYPVGFPIYYQGEYQTDKEYPLYIQHLTAAFKIKNHKLPTVQDKHSCFFVQTEYITDTQGEIIDLYLTSVDLKLFLEHYDTMYLTYIDGMKFVGEAGVFNNYIDHWNEKKMTSTGGKRTIAKLQLNSLYGKFASSTDSTIKIPYLNDKDIVTYRKEKQPDRTSEYTPVACFVTSYARDITIRIAQKAYDENRFLYSDTDSVHISGDTIPEYFDVDPVRLGAWKQELVFIKARYLHAKAYIEVTADGTETKCAGMPDNLKEKCDFDNFKRGLSLDGKLTPKRYNGGICLEATTFCIK